MHQEDVEIMLEPVGSARLIEKGDAVQVPNWRPWCLRLSFLIPAVIVTLLHSALCAVLIWLSYTNKSVFEFSASHAGAYMLWQFLPITLALVPGLIWEASYISMCQMQPYQDLASPQGATLKDSLSQSYVTSFTWFVPYHAMRNPKRHTALAMMAITYLLSYSCLPPATVAMLKIHWDNENSPTQGTARPLNYMILVALALSVSASAFAVASFIILHRTNSGVHDNPAGIAGLGALVAESNLLDKFRSLRSFETQAGIDKALGDYQLCLENTSGNHDSYQISLLDPAQVVPDRPGTSIVRESNEAHPWWLRGTTYLGLSAVLTIPLVLSSTLEVLSQTSNAFYVKISYTIVAVASSALVANWHIHVAILQPFHDLAERLGKQGLRGSVNALEMNFVGSAVSNLVPKHASSVWWIAMNAFMSQLNVIVLPAVTQNRAFVLAVAGISASPDTYDASEIVGVIPQGVRLMTHIYYGFIGIMYFFALVALIIVMTTKRKPFMPRKPHTLSSVILYLCHGKELLEDLRGTSMLSKKGRMYHLTRDNHKYAFGWISDETKTVSHVGINRLENLTAVFKYPKLNNLGPQQPETYIIHGSDRGLSVKTPDCWPKEVR